MAMSLLPPAPQPHRSNRNLICGVCRDVYCSPRFLPCHHSFCLQCLEGLARACGTHIPCPSCRRVAPVPFGGVQQFTRNFYISDDELDRERNQDALPMCATHQMEELIYFCKMCDQSICSRCKNTRHEGHHGTVDLFEEAERCKGELAATSKRLRRSINRLSKKTALAQDNLKASREKTVKLKEQVQAQHSAIVARATKIRDKVLEDLDELTKEVDKDLTSDAQTVQQHLDTLIQLQQQVSHALDSANIAEVVAVEKEMREGEGSVEELAEIERSIPSTTQRPGLKGDAGSLNDGDLLLFIGSPVKLQLPSCDVANSDSITPFFRCGVDGSHREVHAICSPSRLFLWAAYGGRAPEYNDEIEVSIGHTGTEANKYSLIGERITYSREMAEAVRVNYLHGQGELLLHGISNVSIRLKIFPEEKRGVIQKKTVSSQYCYGTQFIHRAAAADQSKRPHCAYSTQYGCQRAVDVYQSKKADSRQACGYAWVDLNHSKPLRFTGIQLVCAFDANFDGDLFAVIGEEDASLDSNAMVCSGGNTDNENSAFNGDGNTDPKNSSIRKRSVYLYRLDHEDPVAIYTPPENQNFFPTSVCFWKTNPAGQLLLVADWLNDSVHVVRVEDDQFHFKRYLAGGSTHLLRPTALDVDLNGIVWIGCENGWILRCKPGPDFQAEEEEDELGDQLDSDHLLHVENESTTDTISQFSVETA